MKQILIRSLVVFPGATLAAESEPARLEPVLKSAALAAKPQSIVPQQKVIIANVMMQGSEGVNT